MWEIDTLLTSSIELMKKSTLEKENKKSIIWNLENIPETYEFDAGGFSKSELEDNFNYRKMNAYELGVLIAIEAREIGKHHLVYDWSAFLLNFWSEYFSKIDKLENLKSNYLEKMKAIFSQLEFKDYKPIHATLTIYKEGKDWFSDEQNDLIKWYCA